MSRKISRALSCATCALLGVGVVKPAVAEAWNIDLGLLGYAEKDRNVGLEFLLKADRELANDDRLSVGVEIDTLTGATPNGATASNVPQTFTMSSGSGSYIVEANNLPADDTHMDTRLAVDTSYLNQRDNNIGISYDGRLSMEFDYLSFGLGNGYQWDLNQNNTSLQLNVRGQYDMVHPVGNVPDSLSLMTAAGTEQNRNVASTTRRLIEAGLGITQVIDQKSLIQMRYTRTQQSGYLNDPYKLVSIINDSDIDTGSTLAYRFESRPRVRNTDTLYLAWKRQVSDGIVDLSYRYLTDSWELDSHTIELRYRHPLSGGRYIQPKLRLYTQTGSYFFRHSLPGSEALPEFVTADTRLAEFDALSIGVTYALAQKNHSGLRVITEYYRQQGDSSPEDAIGLQRAQDLNPTFQALVFKLIYSTEW